MLLLVQIWLEGQFWVGIRGDDVTNNETKPTFDSSVGRAEATLMTAFRLVNESQI